jgi:hypothetical protein
LLLLLAGCLQDAPDDWPATQGTLECGAGAEGLTLWQAEVSGEGAGEALQGGAVGTACQAGPECATHYCMTSANIGAFIKGAEVPNGYCSALFCAVDGSDGACTAAMGGVCFSLYPFLGEGLGMKGICLAPCEVDADCRVADDNLCLRVQDLVDAGLMDAAVMAQYYSQAAAGCLPRSVAEAAREKLRQQAR